MSDRYTVGVDVDTCEPQRHHYCLDGKALCRTNKLWGCDVTTDRSRVDCAECLAFAKAEESVSLHERLKAQANAHRPIEGRKDDAKKLDWTLLPWDGLEPIVRVLEFGAKKYARDNWRKVPDSTFRYRKALLRHVIAWCAGEETDPETGESHLAHAGCCILFLLGKRKTE